MSFPTRRHGPLRRAGPSLRCGLAIYLLPALILFALLVQPAGLVPAEDRPDPGEPEIAWPRQGDHTGADGAPMVRVPEGPFLMGSGDEDDYYEWDERPQHEPFLRGFSIDKYEVTNSQYRRFLSSPDAKEHPGCHESEPEGKDHTPRLKSWTHKRAGSPDRPVVGVDWWDAFAYCAWAQKRLPTEAEWEKAARGTDGRVYPWGNRWEWFRSNTAESGQFRSKPVGSRPAGTTPYGAEDMAGNVREWVSDWYEERYYRKSPDRDPAGPPAGRYRVIRGGSWYWEPGNVRVADRRRLPPGERFKDLGFRCAADER